MARLEAGELAAGLALLDQALALLPEDAGCLLARGAALLQLDRPGEALEALDRALLARPGHVRLLANRGSALVALGRHEEALEALRAAAALQPRDVATLTTLGLALASAGQRLASLDCHQRAVAAAPNLPEAWTNLGNVQLELRRPAEALESYRHAVALDAGFVKARHNCCRALLELHAPDDALKLLDELLARVPAEPLMLRTRAELLKLLKRPEEARGTLEEALARFPEDADLALALAQALRDAGELAGAIQLLRRFVDHPRLGSRFTTPLLQAQLAACDWTDLELLSGRLREEIDTRDRAPPFAFLALESTPAEQRHCAEQYVKATLGDEIGIAQEYCLPERPQERADQRIRLLYVSPDFRNHPVGHQIVRLLELHDRQRFEVIGVALEPDDRSEVARRLRAACDRVIEAAGMTDAELLGAVRPIGADLAIDLAGHTWGSRLGLFAARLAPVQVSFLGYPGTLGSPCHDYLIADRHVVPAGADGDYTEAVVRLPGCYQPTDPVDLPYPPAETRVAAGLPEQGMVYCCFNNAFKITPQTFRAWLEILARVPDSVLWFGALPALARDNLRRSAVAGGIDPRRLVFAERRERRADHLGRLALADLFLDTLPFNAHATASDALLAGLPVLSCPGRAFAGRVAAGMLHAAGLHELVVDSPEQYVEQGVALAARRTRLAELSQRLREERRRLPLFDMPDYARQIEAAYELMVASRHDGASPGPFSIIPHRFV